MQDALKKQYELQAKVNAAEKEKQSSVEKLEEAQKNRILTQERINELEKESENDPVKFKQLYEQEYNGRIKKLEDEVDAAQQKYNNYSEALKEVKAETEELGKINNEAKKGYEEIQKRSDEATESEEKQTKAVDKLSDAYKKAESAVSSYKSSISELADIQKNITEGTEMSTVQMLDLIEKYPELIGSIEETKKGYTLEKQSIEDLMEVRIANLKLAAKEKQAAAEQTFLANKGSKGQLESIKQLFDAGQIRDITVFQGKAYTEGLYEAIEAYSYQKGLDKIVGDVLASGFKEGQKAETETTKAVKKTTKKASETAKKATKDEAEALIEIFKHRYNQGIIDAETYYTELDRIAKEYYGNEGKYLERYMELEDEAQAGIKKAIEDKAKSYQTLKDKIESVTDARKKLLGIESNKNVLAYQEATGFKLEVNQSDLYNASKNLADAKTGLMEALASMSGDVNIYRSLADKLAAVTGEALENILPELTTEENVPTTQNYTFNFGDIKATGDAEAFKKMLNDFVNSVINETQII